MQFLEAFGIVNLWVFLAAGWVLNLTPGPDVFLQISYSLKSGWRAGAAAMCGVLAGCLVHVAASTLGVSALIAASQTAFTVLKLIGAAYLIYVGYRMLTTKVNLNATTSIALSAINTVASNTFDYKSIFIQGFWTNALNPKVALFFLAFLPQFISPSAASPGLAFALLGLIFIINSVPINLAYVLLAAWLSQRFAAVQSSLLWLERAAGALFIGFGIKLALSEKL